ncbi:cytochrome P450 [Thelephora ganbajun]|uniref:Cytochrome P450 n=1 Tax=Thelephora ganbajun TaxID=370292 RepID=A0ACB6Z9W7_THEGA|nr:cytochrome P450 [Thelephora ganbajun]
MLPEFQLQTLWSNPNFLAAGAVVLVILVQSLYEKRKRVSEGRAPMVSHLIPWVGSALEIGGDPDAFFNRAQRKYGDMFTMKAFGRVVTYVVSPSLISEIYRNAQVYDFERFRVTAAVDCFDIPASLMKSEVTSKVLHPAQHKYLSPTGIIPIIESYTTAVWDLLEREGSSFEDVSTPLRNFILPVLYQASAYAFFGRSYPVVESYEPFNDFDRTFHLLLAGVPRFFLRKHTKGLATLHRLFEKYFDGPHDDASEMVLENERVMRSHGYDSNAVGTFFASFLFALMANAPNAGYWLIVLNLQREDGLQPLTDEIDEAVASWKQQNPGQQIEDHLHDFVSTAELPLLASTIQETLRYAASVMSIRRVTEPVEFGGYRFNKDDEIVCLTRSVHLDEEIHENASVYDPRRYMTQKRPTKNGKIVANHSMPWGGGVSMCEGRHFANRELKAFVVFLLMRYTVEIDSKSAERPTFISERVGAGVMHPRGDLRVIIHARK